MPNTTNGTATANNNSNNKVVVDLTGDGRPQQQQQQPQPQLQDRYGWSIRWLFTFVCSYPCFPHSAGGMLLPGQTSGVLQEDNDDNGEILHESNTYSRPNTTGTTRRTYTAGTGSGSRTGMPPPPVTALGSNASLLQRANASGGVGMSHHRTSNGEFTYLVHVCPDIYFSAIVFT